jgi:hypothetical protein
VIVLPEYKRRVSRGWRETIIQPGLTKGGIYLILLHSHVEVTEKRQGVLESWDFEFPQPRRLGGPMMQELMDASTCMQL